MVKSDNITWHQSQVSKAERQALNHHKSVVLWFTGLSGSGKSTIANAVEKALFDRRIVKSSVTFYRRKLQTVSSSLRPYGVDYLNP